MGKAVVCAIIKGPTPTSGSARDGRVSQRSVACRPPEGLVKWHFTRPLGNNVGADDNYN